MDENICSTIALAPVCELSGAEVAMHVLAQTTRFVIRGAISADEAAKISLDMAEAFMRALSTSAVTYEKGDDVSETDILLKLNTGKVTPRKTEEESARHLQCAGVTITEQGTERGLPIVDFELVGKDGKTYFFALTGRLVNAISAAVKGANMRNHGVEEP